MVLTVVRRLLVVTIAGLSLSLVAPTVAHAATATLDRNIYLSSSPNNGDPTASMSREIYLAAGSYRWRVRLGTDTIGSPRDLYLAAGTYTWRCTLNPGSGYYTASCTLNKGSGPATLGPFSGYIYPSGTYNWNSTLTQI